MTFRVGGKEMPFGRVELAYTGAGPAEQVRALARLQGRSFICAIHDEVGNHFDASFIDSAAATLRYALATRRLELLVNEVVSG